MRLSLCGLRSGVGASGMRIVFARCLTLAGALNILYLVNSMGECVEQKCRWSAQSTCSSISRDCVCDLDTRSILVLLLSALTSAAMFAFKISTLEVIKISLDMDTVLEEQHAQLVSELRSTLGGTDFRKVSRVLQEYKPRKLSSFVLGEYVGPTSVAPDGTPNQVRREPL